MDSYPDTTSQTGARLEVAMLPGESWWGLANAFGRDMPFSEKTDIEIDIRRNNYANQALSLLCSNMGRAIWCGEPVAAKISGGKIALSSDSGRIELAEAPERTLRSAFRLAIAKWIPPAGRTPDPLLFSAPQCNTWIELTYGQNEQGILDYARSMIEGGLPPGILMIDDGWQFGYGTWEFDPRHFRDPKGMIRELHQMGFKVMLWVCPFVSMDSPAYRELTGAGCGDGGCGFLCSAFGPDGARRAKWSNDPAAVSWWNGKSALLDFTQPEAVEWFSAQLSRLRREYSVDGFKFDAGSVSNYCGNLIAHDISATAVAQNGLYGAFALDGACNELRNAFGFAGKPVVMRLFDKSHSWEALGQLVPDMTAAGFVGCPFICPDMIGGGNWTSFRPGAPFDPDIFVRSAQIHALSPMMQISASPWRMLSGRHLEAFKEAVALRQHLVPLILELAEESAKSGEPMMRAMEYVFPHQGLDRPLQQFMLGDTLLVAPVISQDGSKTVELPAGRWRDDLGAIHLGPATLRLESVPLNRLPHYERLG